MIWHSMCYSIGKIVDLIEHEVKYSDAVAYSTFALTMVTCMVGLVGNAIVIFFTACVMKKNKSKIFFLNLAINDFASLLLMPFHAFAALSGDWFYGLHVCKIFHFVLCINMYASVFFLMALNISRVLSVAKPIFYQTFISKRVIYWTCTMIWVVSLLSSLPMLYFGKTFKSGDRTYCNFMSSMDFDNGPFDPVYNYTTKHLNFQEKAYLDTYEKYRHFFKTCSPEKCCTNEDTVAKWDHLEFSAKCFNFPLVIVGYFLPLFVVIFSNITIAIQVKKSQTANPHRLYRIVITIIVVYFVAWTPAIVSEMIFLDAVMNRNIIRMLKVINVSSLLYSIACTNYCLNPIMYVLVGRQTRARLADILGSVRHS